MHSHAATANPTTRPPIDELDDPLSHRQLARHTAMRSSGRISSQPCFETTLNHQHANFQDCLLRQVYFPCQIPFLSISELIHWGTTLFFEEDSSARYSNCEFEEAYRHVCYRKTCRVAGVRNKREYFCISEFQSRFLAHQGRGADRVSRSSLGAFQATSRGRGARAVTPHSKKIRCFI